MKIILFMAILAAAFPLTACKSSLEDQQKRLDKFAAKNRYGDYADMWLVRDGMFGSERVALIYAFAPDSEFCFEVAEMYTKKYPDGATYTCQAAN